MVPGDVVQLKSGGPKMTVKSTAEGHAWCEWFDGSSPMLRKFAMVTLLKV